MSATATSRFLFLDSLSFQTAEEGFRYGVSQQFPLRTRTKPLNKNDQTRVVAWRLKLLRQASDMPRSVAQTCRHVGLSRQTFYKWRARYKSHGEAGLCDRPRVPQHFPKATPRVVIS